MRENNPDEWNDGADGLYNIIPIWDHILCDLYKGIDKPQYIIKNPELEKNVTSIFEQ